MPTTTELIAKLKAQWANYAVTEVAEAIHADNQRLAERVAALEAANGCPLCGESRCAIVPCSHPFHAPMEAASKPQEVREQAGPMTAAWREIERLIAVNATHRKGFKIGEVHPPFIIEQAFLELAELDNNPCAEELADLLGVLYHYAIKKGWTMEQLERLMLGKFKQRFTEPQPSSTPPAEQNGHENGGWMNSDQQDATSPHECFGFDKESTHCGQCSWPLKPGFRILNCELTDKEISLLNSIPADAAEHWARGEKWDGEKWTPSEPTDAEYAVIGKAWGKEHGKEPRECNNSPERFVWSSPHGNGNVTSVLPEVYDAIPPTRDLVYGRWFKTDDDAYAALGRAVYKLGWRMPVAEQADKLLDPDAALLEAHEAEQAATQPAIDVSALVALCERWKNKQTGVPRINAIYRECAAELLAVIESKGSSASG